MGVVSITKTSIAIGDPRTVGHHGRNPSWSESVGFQTSPQSAAIEVHRNEKSMVLEVGNPSAFAQRNKSVVGPSQHDFQSSLQKQKTRASYHIKGELGLATIGAHGTSVVTTVPSIEDDGVDLLRPLNFTWSQDGLNHLGQIHSGDHEFSINFSDGITQIKFQSVDVKLHTSSRTAQASVPADHRKCIIGPIDESQIVKLR